MYGIHLTRDFYLMYDAGAFPMVRVLQESDNVYYKGHIRGELYEVNPITMRRLDALEGHPNFYKRELIRLEVFKQPTWMYQWADPFGHIEDATMMPNVAGIHDWRKRNEHER